MTALLKTLQTGNWNNPDDEDLLLMAQAVTKYIRFLDPSVVGAIVKDNHKHAGRWRAGLQARGIDPRLYLWNRSPCCFPGIRRYWKAPEKAWYLNKTGDQPQPFPDALALDSNDYPKELYTYLLGDSLSRILHAYSLLHILNPGAVTNQIWLNLPEADYLADKGIYGLFTSPANTIYVPNCMLNTINANKKLKALLVERALQLYKQVCSLVPPGIQLRTKREERGIDWHIDRFEWAPCFGGGIPLKDFLSYRYDKMESLLSQSQQSQHETAQASLPEGFSQCTSI